MFFSLEAEVAWHYIPMFDVIQNWADLKLAFKSTIIGPLEHIVILNWVAPQIQSLHNTFICFCVYKCK